MNVNMSVYSADAGAVLWAWLAAGLLAAAVYCDVRCDARRLVSARNVVLIGLFGWYVIEAMQGGPAVLRYGATAYVRGILMVLLAAAAFLAGYHRSSASWFDGVGGRVRRLCQWEFRCQTLVVGALIGAVPLVLYGLADPVETFRDVLGSRRTWGGVLARGVLGDFRAVVLMLELFLLGAAWVAMLVLGDRRRSRGLTVLAACVLAWQMIRAYGTGSRTAVFLAMLIPAAWVYWRCDSRRQRGLLVAAIPCALLFYWLAGAMVLGRNEGRLDFARPPSYVGNEMFRELLFIMDQVPGRRSYLYGETYAIELVNPIPRFIWQSKPVGFGVTYASWQGQDALSGGPTLSPGILGEMYANFGAIGIVLLSAVGGIFCRAWDRLGPRRTRSLPVLLFYSLGLGCLLMMGRSFSVTVWYPMLATLICMGIAARTLPDANEIRRTAPSSCRRPSYT